MRSAFQRQATAAGLAASILIAGPAVGQDTSAPSPASSQAAPDPRSYITQPSWARPPRVEFPEQAFAAGVLVGRAQLLCGLLQTGALTDCTVVSETPGGHGFGQAALRGARSASMRVSSSPFAPDARVMFAIRFEAPPPPAPLIENPQWRTAPRPDFPRGARRAGLTSATVKLQCRPTWTARLQNCVVLEESHPGHRFGAAALSAARGAELAPRHLADLDPSVTRIVFTVTFQDEPAR